MGAIPCGCNPTVTNYKYPFDYKYPFVLIYVPYEILQSVTGAPPQLMGDSTRNLIVYIQPVSLLFRAYAGSQEKARLREIIYYYYYYYYYYNLT